MHSTGVDGLSLEHVYQECRLLVHLQVRIELQVFAAHHVISSDQLTRLLRCLRTETDRGTTMTALWGRVVERTGIYDAWQELSFDEQRQVGAAQLKLATWFAAWPSSTTC